MSVTHRCRGTRLDFQKDTMLMEVYGGISRRQFGYCIVPKLRLVWSLLRVIVEVKQCSQRSVIEWVTKVYYLELLRASEGIMPLVQAAFAVISTLSNQKKG
jgi:hypothetical protein